MAYAYKGKKPAPVQTSDVVRDASETRAYIQRLKELDRKFIAAYEPPIRPRGLIAECGTHSGYKTHITNKTPICQPCRVARAIYQRQYRRAQKVAA